MLDGTNSVEDIISKISADYNVDSNMVKNDVEKLIEKMRKHNLIDE